MTKQLFVNANIYTLDQQTPKATGVLIQDGYILEVGDGDQLKVKYSDSDTQLSDLQGSMMIPGLVDSHMHVVAHGLKLRSLDLSNCRDVRQMKRMIEDKINATPKGEWVIGRGWNENNFPDKKILTKEELDEMSSCHPIFLTRVCGHAYLANSLAFTIAGIEDGISDPVGGKFERNHQGKLTGLMVDNAGLMVQAHIPEETFEELKRSLETAIKDCWSLGLVGCHSEDVRYCGGFVQTWRLFDEVIHQDHRFFRVNQLVYFKHVDEMIKAGKGYGDGTSFFDIGAMKIFADGAIGGRSALLSQPYTDDPGNNGVAIHSQEELISLVHKARMHRLPVAVHTIGDLALEMLLDAIEQHPPAKGQHDRIIHAQVLRPKLLERMTKLPIIVDIQPRFVAGDFPWVMDRLGPERTRLSYAWKTLLSAGVMCAGGSDAPIEPVDPILGLHAAVTRIRPEEEVHAGYQPEQKLSPTEALQLFTIGSAIAEQKLHVKGTITPGKYADFTVLDQDLFQTPPKEWLKTKVNMTIVQGQVVYRRG